MSGWRAPKISSAFPGCHINARAYRQSFLLNDFVLAFSPPAAPEQPPRAAIRLPVGAGICSSKVLQILRKERGNTQCWPTVFIQLLFPPFDCFFSENYNKLWCSGYHKRVWCIIMEVKSGSKYERLRKIGIGSYVSIQRDTFIFQSLSATTIT